MNCGTITWMPFSSLASLNVLSCCWWTGGAVSTMRTSTMSGNATLTGCPSTNSTGSRISGKRNFACSPITEAGMPTCSKVSGFMKTHSPASV